MFFPETVYLNIIIAIYIMAIHFGYANIYYKFKFLINLDKKSIDTDDVAQGTKKLQQFYEKDIDENTFTQECIHFKTYMQNVTEKKQQNLFTFFRNQNLGELFPNISIALRIYSCMVVTNCSAERSFLCLKRTKTYLRSTIGENRLNSLALLCVESELVSTIDFQDLIDTFTNHKSQTKMI
jgi:uncharacterized protein YktA (UPF0223 family)